MKNQLRTQYKSIRNLLTPEQVHQNSEQIIQTLLNLPEWKNAKIVMCYLSFQNEVDTYPLYREGWNQGKTMLIPICQAKGSIMKMSILTSMNTLIKNRYGIDELPLPLQQIVSPETIDLCILPGIAFDRLGNRIGFGAGYYDRYLPKLRENVPLIALAHHCQIHSGTLPTDCYDLPVHKIITEQQILSCR